MDVLYAFDLLLLPQKHGHLSAELFEALHWYCEMHFYALVSQYFHVDLRPQDFGQVVRAQDYIYFPLHGSVAENSAIGLALLLQMLHFVFVRLEDSDGGEVLGIHKVNFRFEGLHDFGVDLVHFAEHFDVVLRIFPQKAVDR